MTSIEPRRPGQGRITHVGTFVDGPEPGLTGLWGWDGGDCRVGVVYGRDGLESFAGLTVDELREVAREAGTLVTVREVPSARARSSSATRFIGPDPS
jgi:hypothetical protein